MKPSLTKTSPEPPSATKSNLQFHRPHATTANARRAGIIAAAFLWSMVAVPATSAAPDPSDDRMKSFREAKFGMFIHWGLYAIPAGSEWIMSQNKIPVAEYAEFTEQFNPVKFDAEQWVRVAKDAGMRFIVITSKHHDGFAMFGSKTSSFNIVDATPFKRDPLKELAEACRKAGLKLGFYYSQAQDWHHPGGAASRGQWDPAQRGNFGQYLDTIAKPQVKELLTHYGPVFAIWFDTPVGMKQENVEDFTRLVHDTQPATYINSRILYSGRKITSVKPKQLNELRRLGVDYLSYADREIPERPQWRDWETCMTLNNSWGYNKSDENWKSPAVLVEQLVEIASKGGNFLLNVGPTAEGEIPVPSVSNLKAVGDWLKVNGEAIYGTQASPLAAPSTGERSPAWRSTAAKDRLYIHLLQWPEGGLNIDGVDRKVTGASILADPSPTLLEFRQTGSIVTVTLPATAPHSLASVVRLNLE